MKKKSIFTASFEESLNLEDDGFLQYQLNEQNKKMSKLPRNVLDYFKNALLYGILTLIFPIGFNFLLLVFSTMLYSSDPKDLVFPISNHNFLTAHVYLIGLFVWLKAGAQDLMILNRAPLIEEGGTANSVSNIVGDAVGGFFKGLGSAFG